MKLQYKVMAVGTTEEVDLTSKVDPEVRNDTTSNLQRQLRELPDFTKRSALVYESARMKFRTGLINLVFHFCNAVNPPNSGYGQQISYGANGMDVLDIFISLADLKWSQNSGDDYRMADIDYHISNPIENAIHLFDALYDNKERLEYNDQIKGISDRFCDLESGSPALIPIVWANHMSYLLIWEEENKVYLQLCDQAGLAFTEGLFNKPVEEASIDNSYQYTTGIIYDLGPYEGFVQHMQDLNKVKIFLKKLQFCASQEVRIKSENIEVTPHETLQTYLMGDRKYGALQAQKSEHSLHSRHEIQKGGNCAVTGLLSAISDMAYLAVQRESPEKSPMENRKEARAIAAKYEILALHNLYAECQRRQGMLDRLSILDWCQQELKSYFDEHQNALSDEDTDIATDKILRMDRCIEFIKGVLSNPKYQAKKQQATTGDQSEFNAKSECALLLSYAKAHLDSDSTHDIELLQDIKWLVHQIKYTKYIKSMMLVAHRIEHLQTQYPSPTD